MTGPSNGALPPPLSRYGTYAAVVQNDSPATAELKRQLLLAAIDKSPRMRTDLDLLVITQYFGTLASLMHVSPHALHYIATECTSMVLRDGDVFCYQEDAAAVDSHALLVIEGSLCGYVNKAFSLRADAAEAFTSWNARQNHKRGVLVDFGDFQTTYAAGALCGFDDLLVSVLDACSERLWLRRKGIHAQEQTRAICFKKDTLDRAAQRYGLAVERGVLHSQREAASTDVSHLAVFSAFSEASRQALLLHAPRRHVLRGQTLFASPRDPTSVTIGAVAIVLSGRLDIYWTRALDETNSPKGDSNAQTPDSIRASTPDQPPTTAAAQATLLFSLRRGHALGDHTLGLALDQLYDPVIPARSSSAGSFVRRHALNRLPIRIVSGDDATEVLLVPLALLQEKRAEDHALHEFAAQLALQRQLARQPEATAAHAHAADTALFAVWAPPFFAAKTPAERSPRELHELLWRLRVDARVAKAFCQLPPLVLERVCHAMELVHFDAAVAPLVLDESGSAAGDAPPDELYVVAQGALRGIGADGAQLDVYVPGDVFGLVPRTAVAAGSAVFADPDTMLLAVPRTCVERWLVPVKDGLVADAGSLFQRHAAFIAAHPPRLARSAERRKSLTAMARRASAQSQAAAADGTSEDASGSSTATDDATAHMDALAALLRRMGFLAALPHAVVRELLPQCAIVVKHAGEVVCHENENTTALVAVLSGFVCVFSLEHMGAAIDMFRGHPFCQFASLHHLLAKQDARHDSDGASDSDSSVNGSASGTGAPPSVLARHRSAMYGVHLQTLHAHNAFRAGVLREGTQSPATVVAQTPSVLLVVDAAAYLQALARHAPGIDFALCHVLASGTASAVSPSADPEPVAAGATVALANGQRVFAARLVPQPLVRFVETAPAPSLAWLAALSGARRQLVLRHARLLVLQPGERVLRLGDVVDHVLVVVRGALALYVRQQHDRAASALDASQRSVRSLMLERHVTSNYSTTSHQLSSLDAASAPRLQHKRAMLQQKLSRMVAATATSTATPTAASATIVPEATPGVWPRYVTPMAPPRPSGAPTGTSASSSLFLQSVRAAVREDKRKKSLVGASLVAGEIGAMQPGAGGSSPRKSVTALTFHAAVSRAALAHRLDQRRSGGEHDDAVSPLVTRILRRGAAADDDEDPEDGSADGASHPTRGSTLLCHLRAGDAYGDEALTSSAVVVRSVHDVIAETAPPLPSTAVAAATGAMAASSALPSASPVIEVLCIPRAALLAVLRKSEDDAEQELRGRAKAAKSKWQLAEQIVKRNSLVAARGAATAAAGSKKMPKLFDLFKNILNQRYYVTMRVITDIPLLQDLSDTAKREICAGARFEAVERFANVYKDDPRGNGGRAMAAATPLRYYFVLSGRVGLFPKSAVHSSVGGSVGGGGHGSGGSGGGPAGGKHGSVSMPASSSLAAVTSQYAGLSGSMDACLQEVAPGRGFGELELLVPEASRHHTLAVALEPTKLLSLPAALFLAHWPQVRDMERHIAYLRGDGGARFFARLEPDKLASLYHALRHESYDRGARILEQQQPLAKSEVLFLKDGECSIKHTITLQSLATDADGDGGDRPRDDTADGSRDRSVRVLATIADVRAGHVFWLDAPARAPFALQAVSARVELARVSVDRLRAVLPKSHLAQLEQCSEALAALYREQLARARRTIVRVMNDKRDAELRRRRRPATDADAGAGVDAFLPTLHYAMQASGRRAQLQSLSGGGATTAAATSGRGKKDAGESSWSPTAPAIPYARVLASKPIDLVRVRAEERAEQRWRQEAEAEAEADGGADASADRGGGEAPSNTTSHVRESELDAAYRAAHRREHYRLVEPTATVTLLRGSFPDDPTLRRHQRRRLVRQASDSDRGSGSGRSDGKIDEASTPETVAPAPPASANRRQTPHKKKTATNSLSVDFLGDPAEWAALDDADAVDLVVDVRAHLLAELQSPLAPLRSIKLEPSGAKLHSMGKYVDLPSSRHGNNEDDHEPTPLTAANANVVVSIPRMLPSGWSATPPPRSTPRPPVSVSVSVSVSASPSPSPSPAAHRHAQASPVAQHHAPTVSTAAVTRRRGCLLVLEMPANALAPGFAQDEFLRSVVHRQRRRLVVLEDATLRVFAEDAASGLAASPPPASRAWRIVPLTHGTRVRDAPAVALGEGDVVLRHSFILESHEAAGTATLLLTCETLVDKAAWMAAIRTAAAMGAPPPLVAPAARAENGAPGSPKFKHRQSVAVSLANRETRRLSMISSTLGGRNAVVQEETVLEVEYRIC